MVANYLPHTLVVLDARDLSLVKVLEVEDKQGKSSRVSAVYDAAPRKSFIAALKDIPEIWEISYDDKAAPIYDGLVHDYKLGRRSRCRASSNRAPHAARRSARRFLLRPELRH